MNGAAARDPRDEGLDRLVAFYESLTVQSVPQIARLYAPQAFFRDPFNEVNGVAAIERIFRHLFQQVEAPRFTMTNRLREGNQAMLGWVFRFGSGARTIEIPGVSHLILDAQGRVTSHVDYWDAASGLYARLPLVGPLMRWLRRRLSARN